MELEIQKYLRNGGTPEELKEKYAIEVKSHPKYPNLLLFKYDQIDSPMGEKIVQQSRGIILDSTKNWEVVCYAYGKFFNHLEGHAAKIDLNTAKAYEKVDGSIMTLFWYDNAWQVASSGTPDAGGEVSGGLFQGTFADLFWDIWNKKKYPLPVETNYCYAFEMVSPYNRIVCVYKDANILLHGVRDLNTLEEKEPEEFAKQNGWECVKSYPMSTLEGVAEMAKTLDPINNGEGYVVRDGFFNRVKIKNPAYVALHHLKDSFSERRLAEIVRTNESSEFLVYFEEFREMFDTMTAGYNKVVKEIESVYESIKHIEVQKDFALQATKHKFPGILFNLRKGGSIKKSLEEMHVDKFLDLIKG